MKRRHFFSVSAAGAGAVLLAQCRRSAILSSEVSETQTVAQSSGQSSVNPVYTSSDGLLEVDLEASYRTIDLDGKRARLMAYNGQVPGPRLEAKPGDTVRIRLTNNLPDPTNLHYHGLNISHSGNADNVFLSVAPGESFTYEFTIPKDHPAGTFWYHPHRHGFVADQLFAGLSGFFIIRGPLDEIPEVKAAQEEFIALKDFQLNEAGNIAALNRMALMMGREGSLVTINGQVEPNITRSANGLLRLRLLNASSSRFYRLQLEQHSMHLIATDGGSLSAPVELQELLLTPGERADVLIRSNGTSGSYRLLNLPYDRGGMGMMRNEGHAMRGMMDNMGMEPTESNGVMPLATLTFSNAGAEVSSLPAQLIPVVPLPTAENTRRIELSMRMSLIGGMAFTLNGKTYRENRTDIPVSLGAIEEWEIANVDADRMDHPFHLHAAPFQVVSRNGRPEPYPAWKDTVLVRGGETLRIRIHFKDFPGKSVYHCHILDHEELGMMGIIDVQA
ncbi:MAG: multicopper oxidase family protein [Phormidesmis sp. RL_2_1]|nr:multicopper oxidase family protein [Phormidesmis sp. RL_2_1]